MSHTGSSGWRSYLQAYLRGLKVISQGGQGPRFGCTGLLFAVLFFGMGLVFSFYTGDRVYLECTRTQGSAVRCTIQSRWYGLLLLHETEVVNVHAARLDEHCSDGDCSYRVLLAAAEAEIPLTEYFSASRAPKETAVRSILAYLDDPQASHLALKLGGLPEAGWANLLPPLLVGMGLVVGYFSLRGGRAGRSNRQPQSG